MIELNTEVLKDIRTLLGFTQELFAKEICVAFSYYRLIESKGEASKAILDNIEKKLGISTLFLTKGGDVSPFTNDFYLFCLYDEIGGYNLLIDYIYSRSDVIDVVFLLKDEPTVMECPTVAIALKAVCGRIFLVKKGVTSRATIRIPADERGHPYKKDDKSETFRFIEYFRDQLHRHRVKPVHDRVERIKEDLFAKIANNKVERNDLERFFLDVEYFNKQLVQHREIEQLEQQRKLEQETNVI